MVSKLRVWTDTESVEVDVDEDGVLLPELVTALRFKAENIKAKADPEIFATAADALETCIGYPERAEKHFVEKHIKHGHWEDSSNGWMCSNCQKDYSFNRKYCPNCGALMDD